MMHIPIIAERRLRVTQHFAFDAKSFCVARSCAPPCATVVTGLRNGQFGEDLARRAAAGIAAVEAMGEADPALRVKSYIAWEPLLIKAAGQGVTAIHAGRSSQDILST